MAQQKNHASPIERKPINPLTDSSDSNCFQTGSKRVVHPGIILKDELAEIGITPTELARQIDVPANRVSQIIAGKRAITGDTALRLGHWFKTAPEFWLNLQAQFNLAVAHKEAGEFVRNLPTRGKPAAKREHIRQL